VSTIAHPGLDLEPWRQGVVGDEEMRRRALRIGRLAEWLDRSIRLPFTHRRIGMDGVIGLVPGIGDAATGLMSAYIIAEAARAGARKRVLAQMALHTLVDSTLGSVPLVGDLFDFAYRSNLRNARLALDEMGRIERGELRRT
jgi:hypothetical protein